MDRRRFITAGRFSTGAYPAVAIALALACATPRVARAQQIIREVPRLTEAGEAEGKEVRVLKKDGTKLIGRLVSLTPSSVVLRIKQQMVPTELSTVRRVERVSHHLRSGTFIGVAASAVIWTLIYADTDCADCEDAYGMGTVLTMTAVGAGAGVGAILNKLTARRHLLYSSPPPVRQFGVLPLVTSRTQGVAVVLRW